MKKRLAIIFAAALIVSMCSCGSTSEETEPASSSATNVISSAEDSTAAASTITNEPDSTTDDVSIESSDASDSSITIATSSAEELSDSSVAIAESAEETEPTTKVIIMNNDGETEELTCEELAQVHEDNAARFTNRYIGASVIVTSTVLSIEANEMVCLEDATYTPPITVHLDGDMVVSIPSDNSVVENLNKDDLVMVLGTITGFEKYDKDVAVINTNGHTTTIIKSEDGEINPVTYWAMLNEMSGHDYFEDVYTFANYYIDNYPEDTETIENLNKSLDTITNVCYEETFIKRYDECFSTITSTSAVSAEQYGEGYDYYDSNASSHGQSYASFLQNHGFSQESSTQYVMLEVNGVSQLYARLTNDDGVTIAMAQGDGYVRVLVYSPLRILVQTALNS